MCWFPPSFQWSPANQLSSYATYQTNLNHPQHSNFAWLRLTLRMLWILRAPFIVRPSFFGTFCWRCWFQHPPVPRVSTPCESLRMPPLGSPRASCKLRPCIPASHSSRTSTPELRKVSATSRSHTTTRRGTRYASSSAHRVIPRAIRRASAHSLQQLFFHADISYRWPPFPSRLLGSNPVN